MIDDILPNFTEFFKTFDKIKFMNDVKKDEAVPGNFVMFGEDNPMYGLKGNDHPSSYWHKNERPEDWVIKNRERVLASWKEDDKRREDFSEKFKDTWSKNYEKWQNMLEKMEIMDLKVKKSIILLSLNIRVTFIMVGGN